MDTLSPFTSGISPEATDNMGVYAISGCQCGNVYVGSSLDLDRRAREQFSALRNDRHYNGPLQAAYREQGSNAFVFLVLQNTDDPADLSRYEQEWINHYAKNGMLYNIALCVPKNHPGGHRLSEETRAKISRAQRGRKIRIEKTKARRYRFLKPDGEAVETFGLKALAEQFDLNESHLSKVARGVLAQHKGFRKAP